MPAPSGAVDVVEPPEAAERPTVIPPFDLASFARQSMPPVDSVHPSGQPVPTVMPPKGFRPKDGVEEFHELEDLADLEDVEDVDDDGMLTVIPPPSVTEGAMNAMAASTAPSNLDTAPPRAEMTTLTDADEAARQVVAMPYVPAHIVDSQVPRQKLSTSALYLADARFPTPPPPVPGPDDPVLEIRSFDSDMPSQVPPSQLTAPLDPVVDMRDRFSLGDYSGALAAAESILTTQPSHHEASKFAEECQRVLIKMYAARIGPLDRIPTMMVQPHELRWLSIDHRAGFLLSLVDGMSSIEMILDVSGMPLLDTLRILHELYQQRVISFRT